MDPQQRLLLEARLGGARGRRLPARATSRASATGVFVGVTNSDYCELSARAGRGIDGAHR